MKDHLVEFQYTPYLFPLAATAIISGGVALYVWQRRSLPGAITLAALAMSLAVWSLGYMMEVAVVGLPAKMFWGKSQYPGIVVAPVAWAAFTLQYTGQTRHLTRRKLALAAIIPTITLILALTEGQHHLIWQDARRDESGYFKALVITYGRWFWVHTTISYLAMLLGTVVIIRWLIRSRGLYRGQGVALLVAALAPWVGNVLYLSGLNPVPLDLTPISFTVTLLGLTWGVFRYRLLGLTPIARDTVVEHMSQGMFVLDSQGCLVDFNPAARQMLGVSAAQLIGQRGVDILPDGCCPAENGSQTPTPRLITITVNNQLREIELNASPLQDRHEQVVGQVVTLFDVTDRRRAEADLRQSEERYRSLVEHSPIAIAIHQNGKFVYLNESGIKMMGGAKPADFIGRPVMDFVHPVSLAAVLERAEYLRKGGQANTSLEEKFITLHGRVIDVEVTSIPFSYEGGPAVQALIRDITQHKQAEAALRDSEARNRALLNALPDLMFVQNRDGVYLDYHAPNAADLFVPPEEFLGRSIGDILPETIATAIKTLIEQALSLGQIQLHEYQLPLAGQLRHFEARIVPYGVDKALSIVREITDRKNLEAQLLQARKMEAVGHLAGGIAHDFNNILVPIMGYAELALMKLEPNDVLYADLQQIRKAAERAKTLTRQILAFSRRQVLDMQPVDLNEVVAEFEPMLARLISENIELRLFLTPALPLVTADRGQLEQIILNLAVNARDAMPQGGQLTLETDNVYLDETYADKRAELKPGPYVVLAVSDTGHGIDPDTQQHMFDPFFTTRERDQGTGLGLSMVHGIVKQHNGHIWVYSEPGRGTTFKIYLPQAAKPARLIDPVVVEPADLNGGETVLVVEDDAEVRALVANALTAHGYAVLSASTPEAGLELAKKHTTSIQLLLTDVIMPGMNGPQLFQHIGRLQPQIKVLYISGYTDNVIAHHGVLDEGIDYLQKPFTIRGLTHKVRQVLSFQIGAGHK